MVTEGGKEEGNRIARARMTNNGKGEESDGQTPG